MTIHYVMRKLAGVIGICAALISSESVQAGNRKSPLLRIWVNAPFDVLTNKSDLDFLEEFNKEPIFTYRPRIPYETIQEMIQKEINKNVSGGFNGYEECPTFLCPDADWNVVVSANISFTDPAQPVITQIGSASNNRVGIILDAQSQVTMHADIYIGLDGPFVPDPDDTKVDVNQLIGIQSSAEMQLYPTIIFDESKFSFSLPSEGGDIDVSGLGGDLTILGVEAGAVTGSIFIRNPVFGGLLGAVAGQIAAEKAAEKIKQELNNRITILLRQTAIQIENTAINTIRPSVIILNAIGNALFKTKLPGINKSFTQVKEDYRFSIDLRTTVKDNVVDFRVGVMLDPVRGSHPLSGKVQVPATDCIYGGFGGPDHWNGGIWIPIEVKEIEDNLTGKSCTDELADTLQSGAYNGSTFVGLGSPRFTETAIRREGTGYECKFEVVGAADAGILQLNVESNGIRVDKQRYYSLVTPNPIVASLFDHLGKPISRMGIVLGKEGPRTKDDCPTYSWPPNRKIKPDWEKDVKAFISDPFDPDKCPNCRFKEINFDHDRFVVLQNPDELYKTNWGRSLLKAAGFHEGLDISRTVFSESAMQKLKVLKQRQRSKNLTGR